MRSKEAILRLVFERVEQHLGEQTHGPWFGWAEFSLVDACFGPVFRYFEVFETFASRSIFAGLPYVQPWRRMLAERPGVQQAVSRECHNLLD